MDPISFTDIRKLVEKRRKEMAGREKGRFKELTKRLTGVDKEIARIEKEILRLEGKDGKAKGGKRKGGAARKEGKPSVSRAEAKAKAAEAGEAILKALREAEGALSKSELLERTSIDPSVWNRTVKDLIDAGKVSKTGERRGTRYSLDES